jgi:signal transduction histidine kinase
MRTELEWALLKPRDDTETRTALESLSAQVERLISLSNALLDLEEVRAADTTLREPVHVADLVTRTVGRFGAQADGKGRRIETHAPDDLTLDANPHWLELALSNLVSNALRHGTGKVLVTATLADDRTQLTVSDEGPGFPADFIDKAFDRFARADTSRTTPGTGLGLALVQAVAEAHQGTATITGARVSLDIPTYSLSTHSVSR